MNPRSSALSLMIARASILSGFGLMGFTAALLMLLVPGKGVGFSLLVGSTLAMLLSAYYLRRLHRGARA